MLIPLQEAGQGAGPVPSPPRHSSVSRAGFGPVSGTPPERDCGPGEKAEIGPVVLDQSCRISRVTQARAPFQDLSQSKSSPEAKSMATSARLPEEHS